MDYRQILSNHFRSNGHPVLADQIVSGRFPMVDEIAAMETVRFITIEEYALERDEVIEQCAAEIEMAMSPVLPDTTASIAALVRRLKTTPTA